MSVQTEMLVKLRVFVADDNPRVLAKLSAMLSVEFEVVATAADGKSAVEYIRQLQPDVAIVDLKMPELNGLEVARRVTCCPPRPAVIICSVETDAEIIKNALCTGALGYVFKSRIAKDMTEAVKSVAAGQKFVSSN